MATYSEPTHNSYRDITDLKEYFIDDVERTRKGIGSGTFGVVDELVVGGTPCVGKKTHECLLMDDEEVNRSSEHRFISACNVMSKLQHPNIVQFIGLCTFDESTHPVLVMEKIDDSLETVIATNTNIPHLLILYILKDIMSGLIYLHHQKPPIIHRNLTARNVLVNKTSMIAKIADVGDVLIADPVKFSHAVSQAPEILPYMPPEVLYCSKPNYDLMLDIFSFGHLVLVTVIQKFPKVLLPPIYNDPSTKELIPRSEVERREEFIEMLYSKLTKDHKTTKMILQCLHDLPEKR